MSFPLVKGKQIEAEMMVCPACHREVAGEPNSFAVLSGGAILMDKSGESGGKSDRMEAYLDLDWHGAHGEGQGVDRDIYETVSFAERVQGGQFDIYFCSRQCLRAFLLSWADALEAQVQTAEASALRG